MCKIFLRSMTAYGRARCDLEEVSFLLEITSVNRKYLEVGFNMPKYFQCLELDFRKIILTRLARGNIYINIQLIEHKSHINRLNFGENFSRIKDLKFCLENLKKELGLREDISLSLLLKYLDICKVDVEQYANDYKEILKDTLLEALSMLISSREVEGKEIGKSIVNCLALLSEFVLKIKEFIPKVTETHRIKIVNRIMELEIVPEEKNKLLKEISSLIEKIDITEEVIRVQSHLEQINSIIEEPFLEKKAKGKQLEFLAQEILRELNTMNVKSSDLAVIKLIIDSKIELEKIREQLQNIE